MHIAFVLPDLKGGGAQKMIINMANEFSKRGNQVDLVLFNKAGIYQNIIDSNVNIIDFDKTRSLWAIKNLSSYIRNKNPQILVSALFHVNLISIISKILSFSKTTKLVISERNNLSLRLSEMNMVQGMMIKFLVKIFYPMADKIIGISNGVCEDLKKIIGVSDKIKTIHNPVVTQDFEEKIIEEKPLAFPSDSGLKLITSGRFVLQKDYPTLLRALAFYRKNYGSAHLVILGEGPLKDDMVHMAKRLNIIDNITFLGFVDNPLAYMKQADIFVISSAWEGFCNVIVEALYAGLKVVSTDCPSGPAEILDNQKYGSLVPVGDAEIFAKKIHTMSETIVLSADQKNRALDFTVEKKSDEFQLVFQEILNNEK